MLFYIWLIERLAEKYSGACACACTAVVLNKLGGTKTS